MLLNLVADKELSRKLLVNSLDFNFMDVLKEPRVIQCNQSVAELTCPKISLKENSILYKNFIWKCYVNCFNSISEMKSSNVKLIFKCEKVVSYTKISHVKFWTSLFYMGKGSHFICELRNSCENDQIPYCFVHVEWHVKFTQRIARICT